MPVLKLPNPKTLPKDAIVLDLGDLHRQGETILTQARERATQIMAQGQAERQRLVADAAATGRAAGYAEGLVAGRAAGETAGKAEATAEHKELLAKLAAAWTDALERFLSHRERLIAEGRREVVRLAAAIAQRVVKRAVELDPEIVTDQLGAVLEMVTRPTRLVVACIRGDRAIVEEALPRLALAASGSAAARHVEFTEDAELERGSCVARLGDEPGTGKGSGGSGASGLSGQIDASIATQLDRIVEELLPGERLTRENVATAKIEGGGAVEQAKGSVEAGVVTDASGSVVEALDGGEKAAMPESVADSAGATPPVVPEASEPSASPASPAPPMPPATESGSGS